LSNLSEFYDVIVVGAGPGGGTCAWKCAEKGLKVLVLDRAPALPRYKPCGGGIPASLANDISGLEPSLFADVVVTKLRHSWKGKDPVLAEMTRANGEPAEVWMVMRPTFDEWLVSQAKKYGADVRIGVKVSDVTISDSGVTVTSSEGETFSGKHLVGADGIKGIIGPKVGLRLGKRYGIAREMEIPFVAKDSGIWHEKLEQGACYLDYGTVKNGYTWIFPKKGYLSVGSGMLLPRKPSADAEKNVGHVLKRAMEIILESNNIPWPDATETEATPKIWGHPIPFWTGTEPLNTPDGRALLVGDAAGVVQPLFGEGIQYAMRSGNAAAEHLVAGTTTAYTETIKSLFAEEFDAALRVGTVFHKAPYLSYRLGVKNPAGTKLVGRLMAGEASFANLEHRLYEKLKNPLGK
jgi:geranylgeranyl reductase family protein